MTGLKQMLRILLLLLAVVPLNGCIFLDWLTSTAEPKPVAVEIPQHWALSGRIGVIHGEEGWHGKLDWTQNKGYFKASFSGPFGSKAAEFVSTGSGVELRSPQGKVVSGEKLEAWQKANFGGPFPVRALPYWIHGHPYPGMRNAIVKGKEGAATQITQEKWVVRYSRWREFKDRVMPGKVVLIRGDLRMKLVLDRYRVIKGKGASKRPAKKGGATQGKG